MFCKNWTNWPSWKEVKNTAEFAYPRGDLCVFGIVSELHEFITASINDSMGAWKKIKIAFYQHSFAML